MKCEEIVDKDFSGCISVVKENFMMDTDKLNQINIIHELLKKLIDILERES